MQSRSTSVVSPLVGRAADGLRRIVQALHLSTHVIERRHGLTGAQLFVLQQLSLSSAVSLAELAVRTRTDPSSVSVAVSRLAARHLVKRGRSTNDGRRAAVRLSPRGEAVLMAAPEPAQARLIGALEALSRSELSRLAVVLETLAASMGAPGGPPPMFFETPSRTRRSRGARGRA